MSTYSPLDPGQEVKADLYEHATLPSAVSQVSQMPPSAGPSTAGLVWQHGSPMLRFEDAVVETVVTHTTRTTTSFAPVQLPRIPQPERISIPVHLSTEHYPLAAEPAPKDMRVFALNLAGSRVMVQEDGTFAPESESSTVSQGPGWQRTLFAGADKWHDAERLDLGQAVSRVRPKDHRKRRHEFTRTSTATPNPAKVAENPSPPSTTEGPHAPPRNSPPRKKIRGLPELSIGDNRTALLSPLPSPDRDATSPSENPIPTSAPSVGSGMELAALFSLPSLVSHFEGLPDKLQQQVLMHLLRRSRMPTIQRLYSFAGIALKRDFISYLPHEVAVQILKRVDTSTLASATRVSRKWKRMIDSERCIWQQRLIDDDLNYGLGVEEEEEALVQRRYDALDSQKAEGASRASTPTEDESMESASIIDPPHVERPIPLKHVHRRRYTSTRNWLNEQPIHTAFPGHGTNVVTCLQFDREKIVSASDDHSINIYDTKSGHLRRRLDGHEGGVWALQYMGDTLVSGSTDRTVRIWDLESLELAHVFYGHTSTVRCLQIVEPVLDAATGEYQPPYPMLVTGSRDQTLRVWKLPRRGEPPLRNNFSDDDRVQPDDNPFHIHCLEGHTSAVRALAAYGRICVSGSYDMTVRVWDIVTGQCKHVLTGHEQKVYSIVYDRYRNRCASGSMDNTVKVWNVATGECLQTLSGHTSLVGLLGTSPNYLVSAAADGCLRIWDQNSGDLKHILSSHAGAITCFQHDETKVVSGSDGALKLWDIRTGAYIRDLVVGISSVWQVAFYGNLLVAASNRNGSTVFDIFDFGQQDAYQADVDNVELDNRNRRPWERLNPREPRAYQVDDLDGVELTSPRDFGLNHFSPTGINIMTSYMRNSSLSKASGLGGPSRSRSRRSTRIANRSLGNTSIRSGGFQLEPPARPKRGSTSRHDQRTISPSPAGQSNYHAAGSSTVRGQANSVNQESFAPIFDEERFDEAMDEDVTMAKDEPN